VRYQAQHVDGRGGSLQSLEVAIRVAPLQGRVVVVSVDADRGSVEIAEREAAMSAVPDDLQRHALIDGAHRPRVAQQGVVRVAVDIDEARRNEPSGGVDHIASLRPLDRTDVDYTAVSNTHVCLASGRSGAIDDRAVLDQDIERHRGGLA
jgi:hypothetical protein